MPEDKKPDPAKPGEVAILPINAPPGPPSVLPKVESEFDPTCGDTCLTTIQIANEIKALAPHHRARAEHAGWTDDQWSAHIAENVRKLPPALWPALHAITWHLLAK